MPEQIKPVEKPDNGERRAVLRQADVEYMSLSANAGQACANCIFNHPRDGYDTCAIVQDWPLAIQNTGWCNRWEVQPAPKELEAMQDMDMPYDDMEMMDELRKRPGILTRLRELFISPPDSMWDSPTAFRMLDNGDWIGWYSNNFRDYYGTIFSEQATDDYIYRLESGVLPMPELRAFHVKGTEHGRAKKVFRAGHFVIAYGEFYPDTETEQAYYRANQDKLGMSHGFHYDPNAFIDGVFYSYNTFEISPLPHEYAGNPYTYFMEVRNMSTVLKPEIRDYLVNLMGEDKVTELEQVADSRGQALEQNGAQYRSFVTRDTEALTQQVEALNKRLDVLQQAAQTTPEAEPPPPPEPDTTVTDELADAVRSLTARVEQIDTFLKDKFKTRERATQSQQTIIDAKDAQLQTLQRMNEQPNPQKSFVGNLMEAYRGAPIEAVDFFVGPPAAPIQPTPPTEKTS